MAICHVVVAEKDEGESKRGVGGSVIRSLRTLAYSIVFITLLR